MGVIREHPRLMYIYMHDGTPKMIFGYPSKVVEMMTVMYGEAGLKAVRVL